MCDVSSNTAEQYITHRIFLSNERFLQYRENKLYRKNSAPAGRANCIRQTRHELNSYIQKENIAMLNIKTIRNPLVEGKGTDEFCFRSSCSQNLSLRNLAQEMTDYNSSFTVADNLGMLSVLNTVVVKFLAKGYNVELPFGNIRANATGTCGSIQDGFIPGTGNNQLGILFNANGTATNTVRDTLEYKQVPPDVTGEARLYRLTTLNADASENKDLTVSSGKILRLHGRNLSFDIEDANQGVFLENESGPVRILSYTRRGTNVVDFTVPETLSTGKYTVSIVTRPGKNYFTASIDSEVTVTETLG